MTSQGIIIQLCNHVIWHGNPQKFSLRKSYFSPIWRSFLPQKFPTMRQLNCDFFIGANFLDLKQSALFCQPKILPCLMHIHRIKYVTKIMNKFKFYIHNNFADQHHLSFNADKTQHIKFYRSPNPVSASPRFIFLGQTLSVTQSSWPHPDIKFIQ